MKSSEIAKQLLKEGLTEDSVKKLQEFVNHNCGCLYNNPESLSFSHPILRGSPGISLDSDPKVTVACNCGRTEELKYDITKYSKYAFAVVDDQCIDCGLCYVGYPEYFVEIANPKQGCAAYQGILDPARSKCSIDDVLDTSPLDCII